MLQEEGPVPLGQLQDRHRKRMGMQQCLTLSALGSSKDVGLRNFINGLGSPLELVLWELESRKLGPPPNKGELCVRLTKEALRRLRQPAADPGPLPADSADTLLYSTDTLLSKQAEFKKNTVALLRAEGPVLLCDLFQRLQQRLGLPEIRLPDLLPPNKGKKGKLASLVSTLGHPLELVPCTEENLRPPPTGDGTSSSG